MDATADKKNTKSAKLSVDGKDISLPIQEGTIGPSVMDIGKLYALSLIHI